MEVWGDAGRCGEMRGGVGRCWETWGDVGKCGEVWGGAAGAALARDDGPSSERDVEDRDAVRAARGAQLVVVACRAEVVS